MTHGRVLHCHFDSIIVYIVVTNNIQGQSIIDATKNNQYCMYNYGQHRNASVKSTFAIKLKYYALFIDNDRKQVHNNT